MINHPRVVKERVVVRVNLPDPNNKRVLVVDVDIPLSPNDPDFDEQEYNELIDAVRDAMNDSIDEAEIRRISE